MLFGKNSDRQRNEAQAVERYPRAVHAPGSQLKCSYLTIPQHARTNAVLLCRPFWTWGAEMGANEHGVVIGNEGIHARTPAVEVEALTGLDLLRLALERAATAREAVQVITQLLERHGQGGNCGHLTPSYYNNGYIIADPAEAYVLETVGREWLLERVQSIRSISNVYSIREKAEQMSRGLPALLREFGWGEGAAPTYADFIALPGREHLGQAGARSARSQARLVARNGRLSASDFMRILRDHGDTKSENGAWNPGSAREYSLCMHAGPLDRPGQTTCSMISEVRAQHAVHWVTGSAAPCISIFKPVLLDAELPAHGATPTGRFDAASLWWRHERLHRTAVLEGLPEFLRRIEPEREELEANFQQRVAAVLNGGSTSDKAQVMAWCWRQAQAVEDRWLGYLRGAASPVEETPYQTAWVEMSRLAGLQLR